MANKGSSHILFLLFLGLGYFCCSTQAVKVPAFENGKFYVYEIHGRVSTGIQSQPFSQYAGLEMTASVSVQHYRGDVQMRVSNVKVKKFNQKMNEYFDEINLPFETPEQKLLQTLTYPFKVDFNQGVIDSIEFFAPFDNGFDQNLQRSIAAAFQLNLKSQGEGNENFYSVLEKGIGGECATLYQVSPTDEAPKLFHITKVPMYDKCTRQSHLFYSSITGEKCLQCKDFDTALKRVARTDYIVNGTRTKYTIQKIDVQGAFVFNPFGPLEKTIVVMANQTYTLVRVDTAKRSEVIIQKPEVTTTPIYEFNNDKRDLKNISLDEPHYFNRFYNYKYPFNLQETANLLPNVTDNAEKFRQQSHLVVKLIQLFSRFSYRDFVKFFEDYGRAYKEEADFVFVEQVLGLVGTNPAIKFIAHLIHEQKCEEKWTTVITQLPFHVKEPSETLINEFWEIVSKLQRTCPIFTEPAFHSFGTLLFKACVAHPFNSHPQTSETYMEEKRCLYYLNKLMANFEEKNTDNLLYLRAIKNTRMEASFPFFAKILTNESYPLLYRKLSILAMENFLPHNSLQVAALMFPIFFNVNADFHLRAAAFDMLMLSVPTAETVASLIDAYRKEPMMRIRSYVYRSMEALAKSNYACHKQISPLARDFLKFVKAPRDDSLRHSFKLFVDGGTDLFSYLVELSHLGGNASFYPSHLLFRSALHAYGYNFDMKKVIYSNLDGQNLLSLFGPKAIYYNTLQKLRLFENRVAQNSQKLDKSLLLATWMEIFNNYVAELKPSLEPVESKTAIIQNGIHWEQFIKHIEYSNMEYTIPTELGWPATFSLDLTTYSHIYAIVENYQYFLTGSIVPVFEFDTDIGSDTTTQMAVEVNKFGYYRHGLIFTKNVVSYLPLQTDIKIPNGADFEFNISFKIPEKKIEFYRDDSRLVTFGVGGQELEVKYRNRPFKKSEKYGYEYLGVGATIETSYDDVKPDQNSDSFKAFSFQDVLKSFADSANLIGEFRCSSYSIVLQPSRKNPTKTFSLTFKTESSANPTEDKKIAISVVGIGSDDKREWKIELESKKSFPAGLKRTTNFNFKRSPIPGFDKNAYELCFQMDFEKSDYERIFKSVFGFHNPTLGYEGTIKFGKNCKENSDTLTFKGKGERSEEQKLLDRPNLPLYKQCKTHVDQNFPYHRSCWAVIKDQGRLDKFSLDIDFMKSPEVVKNHIKQALTVLYTMFNPTVAKSEPLSSKNIIHVEANVSYEEPLLDLQVTSPSGKAVFKDIYIPDRWPYYKPYTIVENYRDSTLKKVLNYHDGLCIMSGNQIITTDGVTYQLPQMQNCNHVLFSSCMKSSTVVLVKHSTRKDVIVTFNDDDYVMMYKSGSSIKIYHNREQLFQSFDDKVYEYSEFNLYKYDSGIRMNMHKDGLMLSFDGDNIKLKVHFTFIGIQCGLCGNFNGEKMQEFVTLNGTITDNVKRFVDSYSLCGLCDNVRSPLCGR